MFGPLPASRDASHPATHSPLPLLRQAPNQTLEPTAAPGLDVTDGQTRDDARTSRQVELGQRASASSVLLELHRDIGMSCEGWSSADCSPISQQPCDRHRDEPVKLRSLSRPRAKARFRTLAKTSPGDKEAATHGRIFSSKWARPLRTGSKLSVGHMSRRLDSEFGQSPVRSGCDCWMKRPRGRRPRLRISRTSAITAGMVLKMIFKSSQGDRSLTYLISSSIISLKVVRFFPETCQSPVRPGSARNRSLCQGRYLLYSPGRHGRGPTKLISPRSTLISCGSSSKPDTRRISPNGVTRGSPCASNLVIGVLLSIRLAVCAS